MKEVKIYVIDNEAHVPTSDLAKFCPSDILPTAKSRGLPNSSISPEVDITPNNRSYMMSKGVNSGVPHPTKTCMQSEIFKPMPDVIESIAIHPTTKDGGYSRKNIYNKTSFKNITISDDYRDADFFIVINNPPADMKVLRPEQVLYYKREPSEFTFVQNYWKNISPKSHFFPMDEDHFCYTRWTAKYTYDELKNMEFPQKTKDLSWLTSNLGDGTQSPDIQVLEGHVLRMKFLKKFLEKFDSGLDLYGRRLEKYESPCNKGPTVYKHDALVDYRYTFVFENTTQPGYFSSKLADAVFYGCMPIFWGCSNLEKLLPENSFVRLDITKDDAPEKAIEISKSDFREQHIDDLKKAKEALLDNNRVQAFHRDINLVGEKTGWNIQKPVMEAIESKEITAPFYTSKYWVRNAHKGEKVSIDNLPPYDREYPLHDFNLSKYRQHIYADSTQDGVIERIFDCIGTTNKYFVEFGAVDGNTKSNTANLRINHGWTGLLMDSEPRSHIVHKEFITAENINALFEKYSVPKEFDLLSIDITGNDYWVWKAIDENRFKARVVIMEFNSNWGPDISASIEYNPNHIWDNTNYHGASLLAMKKLGEQKGHSLIYRTDVVNAYFVQRRLIRPRSRDIPIEEIFPEACAIHPPAPERKWVTV